MPTICNEQTPVLPPSYHRREVQAQARIARALHINALSLIETLHLLALCRLAVQLAHRRCPPPLPKGTGGRLRAYREESLLLIALLKTLWRLSYQDVHDWLESWPALALACGLPLDSTGQPRIPSPSQVCKRWQAAGAPPFETLFVLTVWRAVRCHPGLAQNGSRCRHWSCSRTPSPPTATRLSGAYLALSWLWFACAFLGLPSQLS